jgi:stage III sporulation protein AE
MWIFCTNSLITVFIIISTQDIRISREQKIFQQSFQAIAAMRQQMQLIFPIMLTLMAASGGTVSATVCRPAVAFFSTTIVSIIDGVVLPLSVAIIVFSMASKLTNDLKIGKFTAFFKSMNKWIIGICVSVYGIFFTMQGITSVTYDGIVRRAAKYAIGNGIPIVGGFLSGGFDLAVAAGILIKNSLGSMGIFLMISALFKPLVLLISVNLLLRLVSAITQPFGASKISDFLGETAENLHYCTAGLLFTAFMYFLSVMLLVLSTEALL